MSRMRHPLPRANIRGVRLRDFERRRDSRNCERRLAESFRDKTFSVNHSGKSEGFHARLAALCRRIVSERSASASGLCVPTRPNFAASIMVSRESERVHEAQCVLPDWIGAPRVLETLADAPEGVCDQKHVFVGRDASKFQAR